MKVKEYVLQELKVLKKELYNREVGFFYQRDYKSNDFTEKIGKKIDNLIKEIEECDDTS